MNNEESVLMNMTEFQRYLGIGKTKAWEIVNNGDNHFVVRVGSRVLIHKELLDETLKKIAKFGLKL